MRLHCITGILLTMLVMIIGGCSGGGKTDRAAIAVSFEPQAWMLRQIAGDDFDIITLLPAGSDPETYQPSIGTMKGLGKAEVYFTLGTDGFERSLTSGIASNFPQLKVVDITEGVDKITGTHGHHDHDGHDHGHWDSYRKTAETLKRRLKAMDDSIGNMGLSGKSFAMKHPSLSYFSRDYGLNQIALHADGKEASPIQLRRQMDSLTNSGTKVFIVEKEHASPGDDETARQLGLKTVEVSLNSADWLDDLMKTANEINRN